MKSFFLKTMYYFCDKHKKAAFKAADLLKRFGRRERIRTFDF